MTIPLFLIPILVGLTAQALKPFLNANWYAQLSDGGQKIPRYGGMPSAHIAFATSLTTVVGVAQGISSTAFAIAIAVLIFVIDDALRMRIFLSRHGQALSKLVAKLPAEDQKDFPYLETRLGHKTSEAMAGAVLGVALSLVLLYLVRTW